MNSLFMMWKRCRRLTRLVLEYGRWVRDIDRRLEVVEGKEQAREDEDEAATHAPGCKCGMH